MSGYSLESVGELWSLGHETHQLITGRADELAEQSRYPEVGSVHVLTTLAEDPRIGQTFSRFGLTPPVLHDFLHRNSPRAGTRPVGLAEDLVAGIRLADQERGLLAAVDVSPDLLVAGICMDESRVAIGSGVGITIRRLFAELGVNSLNLRWAIFRGQEQLV